jgi:hypothetical protein
VTHTLLPTLRKALLDIAHTGRPTTGMWRYDARELAEYGLITAACHDRPPHTCTEATCDQCDRWVLTDQGAEVVRELTTDPWDTIPLFG